ncbi:hypothetical protein Dimus_016559, partial [Dionaea muscipula]
VLDQNGEGEVLKIPGDLMRVVVPVFPPSESNLVRSGLLSSNGMSVGEKKLIPYVELNDYPAGKEIQKLWSCRMAEFRKEAVTYFEQGHVRVGMETVADPAFHVTRNMQDFITWVDSSSFRRKVLQYHQKLDDYDVMA